MAESNIMGNSSKQNKASEDSEMDESDEEEALFEVEKVIGKSKIRGTVMYKVRWKGYGASDDTWEPVENLQSCLDIIEEYNERQAEIARKRADDRKTKKLMMEGYTVPDNTEKPTDNLSSLYPATFKNTFWKELEAGRVNVFDNDMYSKVKGRSVKQTNEKQTDESPTQEADGNTKKKRALSDPETGSSTKSESSGNVLCKSKSASQIQEKQSNTRSKHNRHSSDSSRKMNINNITIVSESESENEQEKSPVIKVITNKLDNAESDSTDNEMLRPALNIVIKKIPKETDKDKGCSVISHDNDATAVSYSVVQRFSGGESPKASTNDRQATGKDQVSNSHHSHKESNYSSSSKKKKKHSKHHKHHKRKSSSSSRDRCYSENSNDKQQDSERKRKMSTSSLSQMDTENSARTRVKVPKLESHGEKDGCESESSVSRSRSESLCLSKDTESLDSDKVELKNQSENHKEIDTSQHTNHVSPSDASNSRTHRSDTEKKDINFDTIASNKIIETSVSGTDFLCHMKSEVPRLLEHNNNSSDLITQHFNRSQASTDPLDVNTSTSMNSNSAGVNSCSSLQQGQVTMNVKSEVDRQDSETVDSGIASPASDRSVGISRKDLLHVNALDDILGRSILPLLPDNDKTQKRGADNDLEIDLDDVDWDLFDKEVKLTPITLTNSEFARAVIDGNYELVKQAFMGDGKYDLEHPDMSGKTLLMYAAQQGHDDIIDLLIEHGSDIDAQMSNGFTSLMMACEYAEICTVNLLLERNCKVNLQCKNGETALMMAAKRGHNQILWLLLECGGNFNMTSHLGHTALTYVKHLHYDDTQSIITSHIHRVMSEFDRQVAITMNNTAKIVSSLFSPQVFNVCEGETFKVVFEHCLQPHNPGVGFLLFVGHAVFTSEEVKCRFYGPCAVKYVTLNGHQQSPLTQEGNFVLAFSPLVNGRNVLTVNAVNAPEVKTKLIVCAYKAELI